MKYTKYVRWKQLRLDRRAAEQRWKKLRDGSCSTESCIRSTHSDKWHLKKDGKEWWA